MKLFVLEKIKKKKKKPNNYCHWTGLMGHFYGVFFSPAVLESCPKLK